MSGPLRVAAFHIGPHPASRGPAIEVVLADGRRALVDLEVDTASAIADQLRECIDGRVFQHAPSRRVLSVTFVDPAYAATEAPSSTGAAIVPSLEADLRAQGPL